MTTTRVTLGYCATGGTYRSQLTWAQRDLASTARLASGRGKRAERAQTHIPRLKADAEGRKKALAAHISQCEQCGRAATSTALNVVGR